VKKIIFLLLVIIAILFTAQIKRGGLGLLILADTMRAPENSVMGKLIDGPTVTKVNIPGKDRIIHADLYRPEKEGKLFPLLLVHGVNPTGKDDGQLVLLAKDLARAGFLVLVPDFEGMKTLRLRVSDAEEILMSYVYLSGLDHAGPRGGMLGIGYGAGPLLLAAADPRIRDRVGVLAAFGGYYDLRTVLLYSLTGAFEYNGHRGSFRPESSLRWMIAYKNLDLLRSSADREIFRRIIEKRNQYETAAADSLVKTLGTEGRALYDFLANADQGRFDTLYENLSLPMRELVYQLSPSRAIPYITASFIVAHATDDYFIPYTESMRLADAVNDRNRVTLALLPQFQHPEPSAIDWFQRYVLGGWRLFTALYELLEKGEIQ
jgi:dienelactone hydrolase